MAYVDQERKKELAPGIKAVLKKYNIKGTIAVRHHSTLVVNLKSGPIDFENSVAQKPDPVTARVNEFHSQVNTYHIDRHWTGTAGEFLTELKYAMMIGNFDKSDIQTDYFHVGWYIDINIGHWQKPYVVAS